MEGQTEETAAANGVATTPEAKETKAARPWLALGYKTRDEYRKATGKATGKKAKKVKAKVKAKSSAKPKVKKAKAKKAAATKVKSKGKKATKKAVKAKVAAKGKHYPMTAKERRQSRLRTQKFMKASGKRTEPNKDEAKLLKFVKPGKTKTIDEMSGLFKGTLAKRKSQVRNALRWCRASKKFKMLGEGRYKRVAK